MPRLDLPRDVPLNPIPGAPPDPMQQVPGCRFHPRCAMAGAACSERVPALEAQGGHEVACWHPDPSGSPIRKAVA